MQTNPRQIDASEQIARNSRERYAGETLPGTRILEAIGAHRAARAVNGGSGSAYAVHRGPLSLDNQLFLFGRYHGRGSFVVCADGHFYYSKKGCALTTGDITP